MTPHPLRPEAIPQALPRLHERPLPGNGWFRRFRVPHQFNREVIAFFERVLGRQPKRRVGSG